MSLELGSRPMGPGVAMMARNIAIVALAATFGVGPAFARGQTAIELPRLPLQRLLSRAAYQMVSQTCLDISFAKSVGKTLEDYSRFRSQLVLPSWNVIKGKGIGALVTMMYVNNSVFEDYKLEILEESTTRVKVRSNRPYVASFDKDLMLRGATLDEYERFRALGMNDVAAYLGYDYRETVEAGWLVIEITQRK